MGLMDNLKKDLQKVTEGSKGKLKALADIARLTSEKKKVLTLLKKTYEEAGETVMSLYRDKKDAHSLQPILDDFLARILSLEEQLRNIETEIAAKRKEAAQAGAAKEEIEKVEREGE